MGPESAKSARASQSRRRQAQPDVGPCLASASHAPTRHLTQRQPAGTVRRPNVQTEWSATLARMDTRLAQAPVSTPTTRPRTLEYRGLILVVYPASALLATVSVRAAYRSPRRSSRPVDIYALGGAAQHEGLNVARLELPGPRTRRCIDWAPGHSLGKTTGRDCQAQARPRAAESSMDDRRSSRPTLATTARILEPAARPVSTARGALRITWEQAPPGMLPTPLSATGTVA